MRVFPGARFVGGAVEPTPRDRVDVKVTLTVKPVEPVTMYLRSFDVDDPTAHDNDVDEELEEEDNRGLTPAQSGMFEGEVGGVKAHMFTEEEELVAFQTTIQPGDNFRVVVNGDRDFLLALHNDDRILGPDNANKQRIVSPHVLNAPGTPPPTPAEAEVREADKYVSDVLTVWRVLHVEVDSMGPVTGNFVEGYITALRDIMGNNVHSDVATQATVTNNLNDGSPQLNGPNVGNGRFENGKLTIAGTHDIDMIDGNGSNFFRRAAGLDICAIPLPFMATAAPQPGGGPPASMAGTVTRVRSQTILELSITSGSLTSGFDGGVISIGGGATMAIIDINVAGDEVRVDVLRVPFRAVDDDTLIEGMDVPDPDVSIIATAFAPAYVLPRFDAGISDDNLPFHENVPSSPVNLFRAPWKFDAVGEEANPRYWCVYLLGCFQGPHAQDADPNFPVESSLFGRVDAINGQGANIYTQMFANEYPPDPNSGIGEGYTVAHEIGHLFNGLHADGGLMSQTGVRTSADFAPVTLEKIRSILHP